MYEKLNVTITDVKFKDNIVEIMFHNDEHNRNIRETFDLKDEYQSLRLSFLLESYGVEEEFENIEADDSDPKSHMKEVYSLIFIILRVIKDEKIKIPIMADSKGMLYSNTISDKYDKKLKEGLSRL